MKSTFHAQAIATNTLHEQLLTTLACALGWGAVYAICVRLLTPRWLNSAHKVDWASRVVSTAHALILCLASGWHVSSNEWFSGFGTADRSWELWIQFSCGYFVYDALLVLLVCPGHTDKWQTLLHHCLALLLHFVPVCVYHVFHAILRSGLPQRGLHPLPQRPVAYDQGRSRKLASVRTQRRVPSGDVFRVPRPLRRCQCVPSLCCCAKARAALI
jgi:hypothetical protein